MAIKPERLSMAHYDIKFDKNNMNIMNVVNKKYGAVMFKQQSVDAGVNLMFTSELTIYTSEYKEDILNIIHILLDDMSESVSIKAEYMEEGKGISDYTTNPNEKDAAGQLLRYLILIKD